MNALMSPGEPTGAAPSASPPSVAPPMGAMGGQMASPGPQDAPGGPMPPGPATQPPTPEQVRQARAHVGAMVSGLRALLAKPVGSLTRKDVFDAASEMIAKGAFPTPESKQQLIAELASMPEDEPGMRRALGSFLLQSSQAATGLGHIERAMGVSDAV